MSRSAILHLPIPLIWTSLEIITRRRQQTCLDMFSLACPLIFSYPSTSAETQFTPCRLLPSSFETQSRVAAHRGERRALQFRLRTEVLSETSSCDED